MPADELNEAKRIARGVAFAVREGCNPALGSQLSGHVLASGLIAPDAIVAGFWPIRTEIDIKPLLLALYGRGHRLCLPRTPPRGAPLTFHDWTPGDTLTRGSMGTLQPTGPAIVPTVLLVPLLAFDDTGVRLGYGGGYYDRTLAMLPDAVAIGCAFAAQRVASVPRGPHDKPLDAIATEQGVFTPTRA